MSKKHNPIKVTVVIVNYFCADQTQELILFLLGIKSSLFDISIICSDNSNDNKQKVLLKKLSQSTPRITLFFNNQNLGFGNAINAAVHDQTGFDYLLLINPDVTLKKGSIEQLIHATLSTKAAGIWGGITVTNDNQPDGRHAWREPTLIRSLVWSIGLKRSIKHDCLIDNYKTTPSTESDVPYPVDSVSGCCMLIAKDVWTKNRGFDTRFFLYSEEIDFCRRARLNGFQPTTVPKSRLIHKASYNSENTSRLLLLHHAKFIYAKIHHGIIHQICYRLIIAIGALIRAFVFITKDKRNSKSWWQVFLLAMKPVKSFSINKTKRVH